MKKNKLFIITIFLIFMFSTIAFANTNETKKLTLQLDVTYELEVTYDNFLIVAQNVETKDEYAFNFTKDNHIIEKKLPVGTYNIRCDRTELKACKVILDANKVTTISFVEDNKNSETFINMIIIFIKILLVLSTILLFVIIFVSKEIFKTKIIHIIFCLTIDMICIITLIIQYL